MIAVDRPFELVFDCPITNSNNNNNNSNHHHHHHNNNNNTLVDYEPKYHPHQQQHPSHHPSEQLSSGPTPTNTSINDHPPSVSVSTSRPPRIMTFVPRHPLQIDLNYDLPQASHSAPHLSSSPVQLTSLPIPNPHISNNTTNSITSLEPRLPSSIYQKRFRALLEIIQTESNYLADLRLLDSIYLNRIDRLESLEPEQGSVIRRNLDQIIELTERLNRRLHLAITSFGHHHSPRATLQTRPYSEQPFDPSSDDQLELCLDADSQLNLSMIRTDENQTDQLIERVAKAFISESPIFTVYEEFCSKHNEAADLIRSFESNPEWNSILHSTPANPTPTSNHAPTLTSASSHISLASAAAHHSSVPSSLNHPIVSTSHLIPLIHNPALPISSNTSITFNQIPPTPVVSTINLNSLNTTSSISNSTHPLSITTSLSCSPSSSRLTLQDFIIKPIQRIMRYPMLLNSLLLQMKPPSTCVESLHSVPEKKARDKVTIALKLMREVTQAVDLAKQSREIELKTELIASRMELHPSYRAAFVCLLGQIRLVGSLHVLYHLPAAQPQTTPFSAASANISTNPPAHLGSTVSHPTLSNASNAADTISLAETMSKIKYHGVFLYQTHLVIVKVKRATVYEPRHWFPIRYFELVDHSDSSGLIPYSFSLKHRNHIFEFGARCEAEKKIWVNEFKLAKEEVEKERRIQIMTEHSIVDDSIVSSINLNDVGPTDVNRSGTICVQTEDDSHVENMESASVTPPPSSSTLAAGNNTKVSQRLSRNVNTLLGRTAEVSQAAIDLKLTEVFSEVLLCARLQHQQQLESESGIGSRMRTYSSSGANGAPSPKRNQNQVAKNNSQDRKLKRMSCMESFRQGSMVGMVPHEAVPPIPPLTGSLDWLDGQTDAEGLKRVKSGLLGSHAKAEEDDKEVEGSEELEAEENVILEEAAQEVKGKKRRSLSEVTSNVVEKEEQEKMSAEQHGEEIFSRRSIWLPGLKMVRRLSRVSTINSRSSIRHNKGVIEETEEEEVGGDHNQKKKTRTGDVVCGEEEQMKVRNQLKEEKENFNDGVHLNSGGTGKLGGIGQVLRSMIKFGSSSSSTL